MVCVLEKQRAPRGSSSVCFSNAPGESRNAITSSLVGLDFKNTLPMGFFGSEREFGLEARAFFSGALRYSAIFVV